MPLVLATLAGLSSRDERATGSRSVPTHGNDSATLARKRIKIHPIRRGLTGLNTPVMMAALKRDPETLKPSSVVGLAVMGILLLLLAACDSRDAHKNSHAKTLTTDNIAIGMSLDDFYDIFPQARLSADGEWSRPDELFGLRGDWTYSFYHKRLSWYLFNSYQSHVDQPNFDLYLTATRNAIKGYTDSLGEPTQVVDGILEFKNPAQGYSGYPVLKALWKSKERTLRVDFALLGSAGEQYQFLFTVEMSR